MRNPPLFGGVMRPKAAHSQFAICSLRSQGELEATGTATASAGSFIAKSAASGGVMRPKAAHSQFAICSLRLQGELEATGTISASVESSLNLPRNVWRIDLQQTTSRQ